MEPLQSPLCHETVKAQANDACLHAAQSLVCWIIKSREHKVSWSTRCWKRSSQIQSLFPFWTESSLVHEDFGSSCLHVFISSPPTRTGGTARSAPTEPARAPVHQYCSQAHQVIGHHPRTHRVSVNSSRFRGSRVPVRRLTAVSRCREKRRPRQNHRKNLARMSLCSALRFFLYFSPFLIFFTFRYVDDLISFFDPLIGVITHNVEVTRLNAMIYNAEWRICRTLDVEVVHTRLS